MEIVSITKKIDKKINYVFRKFEDGFYYVFEFNKYGYGLMARSKKDFETAEKNFSRLQKKYKTA